MDTIKTGSDIIKMILEVLYNTDGKFIEDIANRVLAEKITHIGDSMFHIISEKKCD